ncbi:carbon monoxide dehydrogenase subunit G [Burkholderia cenocepacia]
MAMNLAQTCVLPASPDEVWVALNDPAVLQACLPGCKSLEMSDPQHFESTIQVKVGPVSATFRSGVVLSDLDPPHGYTIAGEGSAGTAGFARITARVSLASHEQGTQLAYDADVEIGGKLMSVGARLIQSAARKNLDQFFTSLTNHFTALRFANGDTSHVPNTAETNDGDGSPQGGEHASSCQRIEGRSETRSVVRDGASAGTTQAVQASGEPTNRQWLTVVFSGLAGLVIGFLIGHWV